MSTILADTFEVPLDSGSSARLGTERYDIVAKVRAGTTKEQAREMMRNLLKERFHLAYHIVPKDFDGYDIVIAKGGPKLKDAAQAGEPSSPPAAVRSSTSAMPLDHDGFPVLPAGRADSVRVTLAGVTRIMFRMSTAADLGTALAFTLAGKPTIDKTGLQGKYDFKLEFSADPGDKASGPGLETALEKQLGLKLEKTTLQQDVLVIDQFISQPVVHIPVIDPCT